MLQKADDPFRPIPARTARAHFGQLLRHVEGRGKSLVIQKRGTPKAILMGIQDYIRLAAPEPAVLRLIGEEARANGSQKLTTRQINQVIAKARRSKNTSR